MPRRDDYDDEDDRDDDDDHRRSSKKKRRRGPNDEDRQMGMFCHLGGIMGIVLPLVLWLTQKEKSAFMDEHGREAVNFQITMLIAHVLGMCTFGLLNILLFPLNILFCVLAGMAANRGEDYQYPLCIRFIKEE